MIGSYFKMLICLGLVSLVLFHCLAHSLVFLDFLRSRTTEKTRIGVFSDTFIGIAPSILLNDIEGAVQPSWAPHAAVWSHVKVMGGLCSLEFYCHLHCTPKTRNLLCSSCTESGIAQEAEQIVV